MTERAQKLILGIQITVYDCTFFQVSGNTDGGLQPIQVVPVQNAAGGQIMLQQQPQVLQTADGQTLMFQPVQVRIQIDELRTCDTLLKHATDLPI